MFTSNKSPALASSVCTSLCALPAALLCEEGAICSKACQGFLIIESGNLRDIYDNGSCCCSVSGGLWQLGIQHYRMCIYCLNERKQVLGYLVIRIMCTSTM
ncbi:unnamed protein product [Sphagnum balticum]